MTKSLVVADWPKKIWLAWCKFFFEPTSPASLGLFRICLGVVTFLSILGKFPSRELFYSDKGIVSAATAATRIPHGHPILYCQWVPDGDPALMWYFLALLFITVLFTLGVFTRIITVLLFLGLLSLSNRNMFVDNAGDHLIRINCFFLMFAPSGTAYSIDRWWRRKKGLEGKEFKLQNLWAQRMLQLQLAYLYLDTVYLKLLGPTWRDGLALYYALDYVELQRFDFKYLFYYLWQIKLATYGVMIAESAMFSLVWFRKFRYWVLLVALMLHEGINLTMQFPIFQYVMMASLVNFIYPEDTEKWINFIFQKKGRALWARLKG